MERGGYSVREQLPLPDKPPYVAHVGNLSFEVTESEINNYFENCSITSVRLIEDKLERKPKGFGYVEFGTLDGLKKALELNGSQFSGRTIRISVADPPKDRDRPDAREFGDWTRKGPLPDLPSTQRRVSERTFGGQRNFDNVSDAGSERPDRRRSPFGQDDGKIRDLGNWERKGPLSPHTQSAPQTDISRPRTKEGPKDRHQSPAWGEGRPQDGLTHPMKEFQERPHIDRAPTAPELDNQWRAKMRPDAPAKSPTPPNELSTPPSPAAAPATLTTRPKLNLTKRSVSQAEIASPASATTDSKASPFGAARPIDTSAREKAIEEKREQARKEQEDKIKEEKRLAAEATKAKKGAASVSADADADKNGAEPKSQTKSYEILKKADDKDRLEDGAVEAGSDAKRAAEENGARPEENITKPKDFPRDMPKSADGGWRRQPGPKTSEGVKRPNPAATSPQNTPTPTSDGLEGDGWSTVAPKPKGSSKNNRRGGGNQAARAIPS
ncbi:MAG: hypothetical protein M1829_002857 [Trizodia sp. TS-e1964]|nr:MAG: hypothetical protein M1829_002857 [Trizodia sp. TS-e1964]